MNKDPMGALAGAAFVFVAAVALGWVLWLLLSVWTGACLEC